MQVNINMWWWAQAQQPSLQRSKIWKAESIFSVFSFSIGGVDNKKQRGTTRNMKSLIIAGARPEFQAGKD